MDYDTLCKLRSDGDLLHMFLYKGVHIIYLNLVCTIIQI